VQAHALSILSLLALAPLRHETHAAGVLPGHIVDVVAGDFYLQAPDTIPAGLTTLRIHVRRARERLTTLLPDALLSNDYGGSCLTDRTRRYAARRSLD